VEDNEDFTQSHRRKQVEIKKSPGKTRVAEALIQKGDARHLQKRLYKTLSKEKERVTRRICPLERKLSA